MPVRRSNTRVGVYVDVANMYRCGGQRLRYDVLREFACRDEAEPVRLNAYVSYDENRAHTDREYEAKVTGFHSALRDLGFKVIVKKVKWYEDESGNLMAKANADLDLAVDALLQSENLDRVLIASGDGDFVRVVHALQNKGCRVEIVALDNVARDLRQEADLFFSGYLIPNLIPLYTDRPQKPWGEIGSRVRGCVLLAPPPGSVRLSALLEPHCARNMADRHAQPRLALWDRFFSRFLPARRGRP